MSTDAAATGAFGHRPGLTEARAAQAALAGADLSKLWRLSDAEVAEALGGLEAVRGSPVPRDREPVERNELVQRRYKSGSAVVGSLRRRAECPATK